MCVCQVRLCSILHSPSIHSYMRKRQSVSPSTRVHRDSRQSRPAIHTSTVHRIVSPAIHPFRTRTHPTPPHSSSHTHTPKNESMDGRQKRQTKPQLTSRRPTRRKQRRGRDCFRGVRAVSAAHGRQGQVVSTWVERVGERSIGVFGKSPCFASFLHAFSIHPSIRPSRHVHAKVCLQYASLSLPPLTPNGHSAMPAYLHATDVDSSTPVCFLPVHTHTPHSPNPSHTKKTARHHKHMGKTANTAHTGTHRKERGRVKRNTAAKKTPQR